MPQKHPPASTTVCVLLFLLNGASVAGSGSFTAPLEARHATVALRQKSAATLMNRCNICDQPFFTKRSDAEFMQYRNPVGRGPSGKTWPRCASQRVQTTAVRRMPKVLSVSSSTFSLAIGCEKLGQPVPDSNFVVESNNAVPQHIQR